jgi:hypothetical protein
LFVKEKMKVRVGMRPAQLAGARRVNQNRVGRQLKAVGVIKLQRLQRGGRNIGATAHGFREDDLCSLRPQPFGCLEQTGEQAAKAAAHDLIGSDALRFDPGGIHKFGTLVIQDGRCVDAGVFENAGGCQDESCFAGTEKASQGNDYGPRGSHLAIFRSLIEALFEWG